MASRIRVEVGNQAEAVVRLKGVVLSEVAPKAEGLVKARAVEVDKVVKADKVVRVKTVVKAAKFTMGSLLL